MKKIGVRLLLLCLAWALIARAPALAGEERAALTLMVYMTGSDLESDGGAATQDIIEMMRSGFDADRVNLILCTGGARTWFNGTPSDQICYYRIAGRRQELLESRALASMGEPSTLSDFLNYAHGRFPAEQYALIFWDHGGGPMNGVCFDELFSGASAGDSLDLSELGDALRDSPFGPDHPLEWVGFDACLMSSVETAYICAPYAKYMIASQETEPGTGWNYRFLSRAGEGLSGGELGRLIVDSYGDVPGADRLMLTLACVDLSGAAAVEAAMNALFGSLDARLSPERFSEISNGRRDAKSFGRASTGSEYDLIDLYSLSEQYRDAAPALVDALQAALERAVVYSAGNQEDSHGLSVYYPYFNKDRYLRRWKQTYGGWGFADGYRRFMSNYGDLWLGGQLADWSGITASAGAAKAEGQEITLPLNGEQLDNFAFAQLFIVRETAFADPYFYKIDEVDDVALDGDGALHARYNYKALYALDGDGNPLTDAISYRIVDGMYLIRANLSDRTWDMWWDDRYPDGFEVNEDATIDLHKVYLQCRMNAAGDGLDVVGVIDMREALGDDINGMLVEGDGLYTGKQTIMLDAEASNWVWIFYFPREICFDDEGRPLPFPQWKDPNTGDDFAVEWDEIDNREPWSLKFCEQQYTGLNLFAQYIIHDTQGNLAASNLIPVANPNLIRLTGEPERFDSGELSVTVNAVDVAASSFEDGLYVRFDVRRGDGYADFDLLWAQNLVIGDCLLYGDYPAHPCVEADGHTSYFINIPSKDLPGQLEAVPEGLRFELCAEDEYGESEKLIEVAMSRALDISAIHAPDWARAPLASAEADGVQYQITGLEIDGDRNLVVTLTLRNDTGGPVDFEWQTRAMVNRCEWPDVLIADELTLPDGCWCGCALKLSTLSAGQNSAFNFNKLPQIDYLKLWGIDAIREIGLFGEDGRRVELTLDAPYVPKGAGGAVREATLFDDGALRMAVRDWIAAGDAVTLIVDIENRAERAVEIAPVGATVNGGRVALGMGDLFGFVASEYDTVTVDPLCRKCAVWKLTLDQEAGAAQAVESVGLSFSLRSGADEERVYTPAVLRFASPTRADAVDWDALDAADVTVEPAEIVDNAPADPLALFDVRLETEGPPRDSAVLLRLRLPEAERETCDHVEVKLFTSAEKPQLIGQIRSPVSVDGDGWATCPFSGLLAAMDGAARPVVQYVTPTRDGYRYDVRGLSLSMEDALSQPVTVKTLYIDLDTRKGAVAIGSAELSRPIGGAERVTEMEYLSAIYQYEGEAGGKLAITGSLVGESAPVDGAPALRLRPAGQFDPWVAFCVTRKDGSACTCAAYYHECAVADDGSGPKLPFAPLF